MLTYFTLHFLAHMLTKVGEKCNGMNLHSSQIPHSHTSYLIRIKPNDAIHVLHPPFIHLAIIFSVNGGISVGDASVACKHLQSLLLS